MKTNHARRLVLAIAFISLGGAGVSAATPPGQQQPAGSQLPNLGQGAPLGTVDGSSPSAQNPAGGVPANGNLGQGATMGPIDGSSPNSRNVTADNPANPNLGQGASTGPIDGSSPSAQNPTRTGTATTSAAANNPLPNNPPANNPFPNNPPH